MSRPAAIVRQISHDIAMAEAFLVALDPGADRFTFQLFSDGTVRHAEIFHGSLRDLWPRVQAFNVPERQIGVFVTVNATDFKGRRRENIVRPRALFVDADGKEQVLRCIDAIRASDATPSFMVRSSEDSAHFYWLCDDLELDEFSRCQQALIEKLGTDTAVKDLPRVMRVPGTLHLKQASSPRLVQLIVKGVPRRWNADELFAKLSLSPFNNSPAHSNTVRVPDSPLDESSDLASGIDIKIEEIRSAVLAIPPTEIASEDRWMRLARALAHTAFTYPHLSEELWAILDEASRRAPNYDADDNRRRWERYIIEAPRCEAPITIATVFALAKSAGWPGQYPQLTVVTSQGNSSAGTGPTFSGAGPTFSGAGTSSGITPNSVSNVVIYAPGHEEACRRALDRVVAADERVFTLEGSGFLAILRVPDREDQSPWMQWDGDLPGTTLATTPDIMERAERLNWRRPAKTGTSRIHPPQNFIANYITQMRGRYGARVLRGIARVPRIDDDGQIHFTSGYDATTHLYHDKTPVFDVVSSPSRDDAVKASQALLLPFSEYGFENQAARNALLLAAIFTAIERPYLPTAPMLIIRSSMAGTGKGLLARCLTQLAYDTYPVVATWGATPEETEKRIQALLLQSPAAICIDNANGKMIQGDLLESIITEGRADIRILGRSENARVHNRSLLMLTGNNPQITGDMARRSLALDIKPRSADPESDRFNIKPVDYIQRRRTDFLRAAFTVMRAYRQAGMPTHSLPAVGSFDDWSTRVRDLVYWLTAYDLADAFRQNKAEDPHRQDDASLLGALYDMYGSSPFKSADVFAIYTEVANAKRASNQHGTFDPKKEALHATLDAVFGSRGVSAKLFGYWARRVKGAHTGGFQLYVRPDPATNSNVITIKRT